MVSLPNPKMPDSFRFATKIVFFTIHLDHYRIFATTIQSIDLFLVSAMRHMADLEASATEVTAAIKDLRWMVKITGIQEKEGW